ncbi:MAG: MBL fold metallo-hydrolase [Planctomycetota bacterium]
MKLTFLGTRGEIEASNRRHRRHSALLVEYYRRRVMIDCGEDWLGHVQEVKPHAIVLTHAHPDHAWGLQGGAPCPVYATEATWEDIAGYPIPQERRHTVTAREPVEVEGVRLEAFPVEHSTRCPAVGYRLTAGNVSVWYAPDLVYIWDRADALHGCRLYVGDGASPARSMVRRRGDRLIGHTPIRTQLTWCQKEGVPEAVFTHCGSGVVDGDERSLAAQLREWAKERGVRAAIAHDGLTRVLR